MMMDAETVQASPALAAHLVHITPVSKYYEDDASHDPRIQPRSPLSRQSLASDATPIYHAGAFYEIDHDEVPLKSPVHLKPIRVVKVSECTNLDITVKFPSLQALRSFFSSCPATGTGPELDERFVMSSNHAARILGRRVAEEELESEVQKYSFWLIKPRIYDFAAPQQVLSRTSSLQPPPPATPVATLGPAVNSCLLTTLKDGDPRHGKDRFSAERYAAAENSLLDIMRSRDARFGAPVLREKARKHIDDTGLLDHLLKHLDGRVPDGSVHRFRRRHNADGAMEYWLEPAELAVVRRQAGVSDPYWVPPPGWKPGDDVSIVAGDLQVKRQVEELAEEVNGLKRQVEQLMCKDDGDFDAVRAYDSLKEKYQCVVSPNEKLEKQVFCLKDMCENVVQMNGELKKEIPSFKEHIADKNDKLKEQITYLSDSFLPFKRGRLSSLLLLFLLILSSFGSINAEVTDTYCGDYTTRVVGYCSIPNTDRACCATVPSLLDSSYCLCSVLDSESANNVGLTAETLTEIYLGCNGTQSFQSLQMLMDSCMNGSHDVSPAPSNPPPPSKPSQADEIQSTEKMPKYAIALIFLLMAFVIIGSAFIWTELGRVKAQSRYHQVPQDIESGLYPRPNQILKQKQIVKEKKTWRSALHPTGGIKKTTRRREAAPDVQLRRSERLKGKNLSPRRSERLKGQKGN